MATNSSGGKASADDYFKDVDHNPPPDTQTHRVDAGSEAAQRPHEPPSGQWSKAGAETEEYRTADRNDPYDAPSTDSSGNGSASGEKLRYGGTETLSQDKGSETSSPGEGPEKTEKFGRKPEGR
ncbi:hypothetical protein CONPUDRAFT_64677 [Coniophora puteana RWD-64-598 SS2]|uniref:Uncharacterized protein n=1 Tax=Coniophora puteana (strain RWD-64-598) TaxID=741705 RepID=A0A5M3MBQ6_CONPW|nr:uncharacterized protein CONPUDRAFT_64677 [Coniophora puteana RWD-64-598 SS2]EIW76513.1 hypothetical protein CONPUDRAFT_64677 [Coniophora puteana RWD-64-598 SS2]